MRLGGAATSSYEVRGTTIKGHWKALFVRNLRRLDHQELLSGLSEYCDALGIAQPRSIEDVVDRRLRPGKRIVGPQHDLARADLGDQVAQPLRREDQRVVIELPQVFGRLLLKRFGAPRGERDAALIRPGSVGGQVAAGMSSADLQPRIGIECSLKN